MYTDALNECCILMPFGVGAGWVVRFNNAMYWRIFTVWKEDGVSGRYHQNHKVNDS